ncbi:MbtH family NRPS accessory protein [Sphaerisporangium sp. NPDC005289]|uniref:MbtH family protein n=1 Tax=Sphaerisporangium sp. NPDC005289 TaxID=3155247 RepID=UPI00339FE7E0
MTSTEDDDRSYLVVVNDEEQYSIWPEDREVPAGWEAVGTGRSKRDCLGYIETVWTDMRPRSLRERMAGS